MSVPPARSSTYYLGRRPSPERVGALGGGVGRGRGRGGGRQVRVDDVGDGVGRHGGHGGEQVVGQLHAAGLVHALVAQRALQPQAAHARL